MADFYEWKEDERYKIVRCRCGGEFFQHIINTKPDEEDPDEYFIFCCSCHRGIKPEPTIDEDLFFKEGPPENLA